MKRSLATLLVLLAAPQAFAAADWTGWTLGVTAGRTSSDVEGRTALSGAWTSESQALRNEVTAQMSQDLDPSGTGWGLHGGYDHQFGNGVVIGGELEYANLGVDETRTVGPRPTTAFPSLSYTTVTAYEIDDQLALRLRLGFAAGDHLVYATGGWVRADVSGVSGISSNGGYAKRGGRDETLGGTQWGAGYEYRAAANWSLRLEVLRTRLDDLAYTTAYLPGSAFTSPVYTEQTTQDATTRDVRIGVSYRF